MKSMTGFGRAEAENGGRKITIEPQDPRTIYFNDFGKLIFHVLHVYFLGRFSCLIGVTNQLPSWKPIFRTHGAMIPVDNGVVDAEQDSL